MPQPPKPPKPPKPPDREARVPVVVDGQECELVFKINPANKAVRPVLEGYVPVEPPPA